MMPHSSLQMCLILVFQLVRSGFRECTGLDCHQVCHKWTTPPTILHGRWERMVYFCCFGDRWSNSGGIENQDSSQEICWRAKAIFFIIFRWTHVKLCGSSILALLFGLWLLHCVIFFDCFSNDCCLSIGLLWTNHCNQ